MLENRRYCRKELAAMLIGERPDELLDYAEREDGVTLVSKSGQKFRITLAALVEWGREVEDGGRKTEDRGLKTGNKGRKRGVKR